MTLEAPQLMARQTSGSAQAGGSPGGTGAGAGATGQDLSGSRFSAARWLEPDATERSPAAAAAQAGPPARHHEVFGFAPYWTLADLQSFDFSNLSTIAYFGTYQLLVNPSFGPRYGTWSVAVDGKSLGDCNGYAPTAASPANASLMGKLALAAGTHSLTFVVNGKDPRSTGYLAGIDLIALIPA